MPELALRQGIYTIGVTITEQGAAKPCAWRYGRTTLHVVGGREVHGLFHMPFEWRQRAADAGGEELRGSGLEERARR